MTKPNLLFIQMPKVSKVDETIVQPTLNLAIDWIEVSPNSWVVWTTSSAKKWRDRFAKKFGERSRIVIIAVDPSERNGWMPKAFWEFLKKHSG